ncbi:MAG: hypothetical protein ACTSXL_04600 [Alphaproteobacteria bacterium]|nr:MAG: hypothetical protein B6I23_02610 [Rickettsiaceae bacterium 4572_127]
MKKLISILFIFFLWSSFSAKAGCSAGSSSANILGITQSDISKNSSDFSCVELAFLKRSGISGITYDDYLKKFKTSLDIAKQLAKKGITPDRQLLVDLKNFDLKKTFQKLKKKILGNYSITFDNVKNTFVQKNKQCTDNMPDFSNLPDTAKPSYFSGNTIYDMLGRVIGNIVPSQNGKAMLKVGNIKQEIKWKTECYSQNIIKQFSNILASCWLCPLYDLFFKAMSTLSYQVWHKIRKPMVGLLAIIFLIWFTIKIIKMFWGIEEFKTKFFTTELLKKLGALAIAGFVLGTEETGYDIVKDFVTLVLTPLSEIAVYISKKFLTGTQCNYIPMAIKTSESMFSPEIKNNIICLLEQLLNYFIDYVLLSLILLMKSLWMLVDVLWEAIKVVGTKLLGGIGVAIGAVVAPKTTFGINFLKSLWSFLLTFILGLGLLVSFVFQMFKTLFYLVDPILKMGIVFLWLPFTFLNWIVDLKIQNTSFKAHFKTLIEGLVVMVFTALIVSLCGTILLALMSTADSYSNFKEAITNRNFVDMWKTIKIEDTIILRLITGIIIVHTMMKKIGEYAKMFMDVKPSSEMGKELKDEVNKAFLKEKKRFNSFKGNFNFFKKMKK